MQFSTYCIECLTRRQAKLLRAQNDEEKAFACFREMLQAMIDAPSGVAAPFVVERFNRIFARYFSDDDRYAQIKRDSNAFVLRRAERIRTVIASADDPVLMGLRYARAGNYIDFGALDGRVSDAQLDDLLDRAHEDVIDPAEYANLISDLAKAKKLLYLTDNAGEIVLDMLLIEALQKDFPALDICVCVRGGPILNDATCTDAEEIGLSRLVRVIDSGVPVGGTQIGYVGKTLQRELDTADVILAKGQGNFETMWGCGLNVYYAFLCKCDWFTKLFRVPRLTGMFVNEHRVRTYEIIE